MKLDKKKKNYTCNGVQKEKKLWSILNSKNISIQFWLLQSLKYIIFGALYLLLCYTNILLDTVHCLRGYIWYILEAGGTPVSRCDWLSWDRFLLYPSLFRY